MALLDLGLSKYLLPAGIVGAGLLVVLASQSGAKGTILGVGAVAGGGLLAYTMLKGKGGAASPFSAIQAGYSKEGS